MSRADPKKSPPPVITRDEKADAIAELYAELIAAWPRVEENRSNSTARVVPYGEIIRLRTVAK